MQDCFSVSSIYTMENDQSSLMNSEGNLPRMGLPPFGHISDLRNHLLVFRMLEVQSCWKIWIVGFVGSVGTGESPDDTSRRYT